MRTLVVGAAIVDLMMKVERLPKSGEDIPCKETKTVVGGCAYNVANTLRNLKCEHDLCVPVGSGSFADIIRRGMKEKGYEPMIEELGEDNGYCLSLVEADGERTFITVQGAECHFKKEWFEQIDMDNYENIYIAGYQVCGKSGEIISQWLKTVENVEEKHIFFAPGPMITAIESETMENLFALKPILHINEAEAKGYTQQENVEEAVRALYEKSGNLVFVTLGAEGTLFYDGKEMRRVASVKTQCCGHCRSRRQSYRGDYCRNVKGNESRRCRITCKSYGSGNCRNVRTGYGPGGISEDFGGMGK